MRENQHHFTYLMLLAMLFWGGGWPALKMLTPHLSLEVVTFWRFAIMLIALTPMLFFLKKPLRLPVKSFLFVLASALLNILFMVVAFLGVKHGLAGSGGVIITTLSPLFTFMLVTIFYKKSLSSLELWGLFFGLAGGAVMLEFFTAPWSLFFQSGNLYYIAAALIWAAITLLSQKSHLHMHPIHYSFFIALIATVILFFVTLQSSLFAVFDQDIEFWGSLLYLGVLGQTVATTIYFFASGKLGSARASSFMFVVPLSALIFSSILLGEPVKLPIVIGGTFSMLAIFFINKNHFKKSTKLP